MQRRAAGAYVAVFLLIAAGAYSLTTVAQEPDVGIEQPDKTLQEQGQNVSFGDRQYNVTSLGDGSAEVAWTEQSANFSTELANNSTMNLSRNGGNTTYRLLIPNESDPQQATLREEQNLTNDTQTIKQNNQTYVVVNGTNGSSANRTLVPVDEYKRQQFGEPQTQTLRQGNSFRYENNSTTVANITNQSVTLQWTGPKNHTTSISSGSRVQLGPNNRTFIAHAEGGRMLLSSNTESYSEQQQAVTHFHERIAGLWGVVILSFLAATLVAMLAYLPNRG